MTEQIIVLDEQKMLTKIMELPNQLEAAWTSLWVKDIGLTKEGINNIVFCGMGGSGISGAIVHELMEQSSSVPSTVWNNYGLPTWVNEQTLVVAVSYSGDTEETVDAIKVAVEKKTKLVAISTGGKVAELAKIHGFPLVEVKYQSAPRAAIGWLLGSVITVLTKLELLNIKEPDYFAALNELKATIGKKIFPDKAEELAISLNNKVPMIFSAPPLNGIAKRWVNQFNENAKTFATANFLPELCHNTIVGTEYAVPEKLMVLFLESRYAFSRNLARAKVLHKWFDSQHIPFVPLSVKSTSSLSEQWLLIHFGDLLSFYLAGVYGVDPTPITSIDFLKEELKKL